jgi:hypothetical protein
LLLIRRFMFIAMGGMMGNELACTLHLDGKSFSGKALLESSVLVFRGETRLRVPFSAITTVQAKDNQLYVRTEDGLAVFALGPQAEKWRDKIANPKSVLDKLGVKPGHSVAVLGDLPTEFLSSLRKHGAVVSAGKIPKDSPWIFLAANCKAELRRLAAIRKSMRGAMALWLVYPKGQRSITEGDVRSAGLKTGLLDVKVVGFSTTHTALKFVLPKNSR